MKKYHKIPTIFKREESGKHKLIEGEYRSETIEQVKDLDWIFTEKIDGTNIRIYWDGHKVQFNGRTDRAQLHQDLWKYLNDTFCTDEIEELFEQKFGEKEVYLFGEGYGAGIQKGGGYSKEKSFILFDAKIGGSYLDREELKNLAESFNISIVPVVLEGTINDAISVVKTKNLSDIGDGSQPFEGVVGRLKYGMYDRFGNRIIVKIKVKDFA